MRLQLFSVSAIGLFCLLTACSQSSGGVASGSSDTATPASDAGSSEAAPAPAPASAQCPVGDWQVTTITGKSGAQINGVPVVAKSGGGFTLALAADNTWTLTGNKAEVTLDAAGLTVAATVDGTGPSWHSGSSTGT